jgi:hypothetical protein
MAKNFNTKQEFADSIISFYLMDKDDIDKIGIRVREVAVIFDFKVLADKLLKAIN